MSKGHRVSVWRLRTVAAFVVLSLSATAAAQAQPTTRRAVVESIDSAFFDDSVVHEIRLTINSRDWQALKDHFMENTYYPCDFKWNDQAVRNIGIRSRGTGSRNGTKPGLRVDFNRYTTDQTFLGLKSFVLRNNTQDASNLHERLGMLMMRRMGLPAPREAFTTLYVNNEYAGLYTIVESIDKAFLKEAFGEDEGYLYKYDYPEGAAPYYFEYRGSDPASYVPSPFAPETHESDSKPEVVEQLVWTINETNEGVFRTAIAAFLDIEQFVRFAAVENFLAERDGMLGFWGMNNFYSYRAPNSTFFRFIAWDKSEAFTGGAEYGLLKNIDTPSWLQNRLMGRAMRFPDLYDTYLDTLLECARSAAEPASTGDDTRPWLERELEREYQQIRSLVLSDPARPFTNDEFAAAIDALRAFAADRGGFVTREVGRLREGR